MNFIGLCRDLSIIESVRAWFVKCMKMKQMHWPIGNCNFKFHMQKGFKNYFTLYWFYCQYLYNWIRNKFLQLISPSPYKYINNINQICIHNHLWWISWLYVRVGILLPCGKHLFDRIISLRGEVWAHNTSLTPPFFLSACIKPG